MENKLVNSIIDKEGVDEAVIKVIMGDVTATIDVLKLIKANCKSIQDKIFYRNVEKVMLKYTFDKVENEYFENTVGVICIYENNV